MILLLAGCGPDLADLEAISATSQFEFIALAPNERRALQIALRDVIQAGDTEREFDLAEFPFPDQGLNLYVGRGLERVVTYPFLHHGGINLCRVREIWHAREGSVVIRSETPISQVSEYGLSSPEIEVSVSGVVLEQVDGGGDLVEVEPQSWRLPLQPIDEEYNIGLANDCRYPDIDTG